jgi:serine/threonine protein kinase
MYIPIESELQCVASERMQTDETEDRIDVWLQTKTRSWRDVLDVMIQAGRQLATDHASRVVHEDIRLDNIFVGIDGKVTLRELMPAKPAAERAAGPTEELRTAAHSLQQRMAALDGMRAAMYLAPEQFRGGAAETASNQFSFSVALYRALYGQTPFDSEWSTSRSQSRPTPLGSVSLSLLLGAFDRTTFINLAREVLSGNIRRPPEGLDVPAWVFPIVERGLSADVDERYPTVKAMVDDLAAGLEGGRMRSSANRASVLPRTWVLIASGIFLLVALGVWASTLSR